MRMLWILLMSLFAALLIMGAAGASDVGSSASPAALVNLELQNTSVTEGINALFQGRGLKYSIDPSVSGEIVEMTLRGVTFEQALKAFADAADFTYTVNDGAYVICMAQKKASSARTTIYGRGPSPEPKQIETKIEPAAKPTEQAQTPQPPPSTQVYVNQGAPVVYNQPAQYSNGGGNGGGYGGYGYNGYPVINSYAPPHVLNFGTTPPPPPPGWVSPEMLRFMRAAYAMQRMPFYITPY